MTLIECAKKGINKVKKAEWANPAAYMELSITNNKFLGPWGRLYDQPAQDALGIESPQSVLIICDESDDWISFD